MKQIILIPDIKVHNANALSSPFTIGFPAMTAWLGAVHALQRKINAQEIPDIKFQSVGVVSHYVDLQIYKGNEDYHYSLIGTGNPLDEEGKRSSFIEEARCHLCVSLIIEANNVPKKFVFDYKELQAVLTHYLNASIKIAGGDILSFSSPVLEIIDDSDANELKKLMRKLKPGYALIERRELMVEAMNDGHDALDALLKYVAINNSCEQDEQGNVLWRGKRETSGWIIPIATGFHGISDLGSVQNQRDPDVPHRFAESLVTLGEFRMLHRINSLDEILWYYHADLENDLYICKQNDRSVMSK